MVGTSQDETITAAELAHSSSNNNNNNNNFPGAFTDTSSRSYTLNVSAHILVPSSGEQNVKKRQYPQATSMIKHGASHTDTHQCITDTH